MRRTALSVLVVLVGAALVAVFYLHGNSGVHSQIASGNTGSAPISTGSYLYYTLKDARGFVIARAPMGVQHQPLAAPQPVSLIGDGFGLSASDSISSMQVSPDGLFLAIDGSRDHGDQVWVYDVRRMTVSLVPAHVSGNFLHWLPRGHRFLYRPMFPLGPDALSNGIWNPGLWIVDAARDTHVNIDIHMASAFLVDAAASPDSSKIVYSTTRGLGLGSDTWLMVGDGSSITHLFSTSTSVRSIAGLFAWSPDGRSVAYERLSDSATPFLPAGLWVMNSQGGSQRWLASADGGHGYMPVWSPDGRKIAFVVRTNLHDQMADEQEQALQCAIGIVDLTSGQSWQAATPQQTGMQWNINPTWSSDSAHITFTALNPTNHVLGGTPRYWSVQASPMHPAATPITPSLSHVVASA